MWSLEADPILQCTFAIKYIMISCTYNESELFFCYDNVPDFPQ